MGAGGFESLAGDFLLPCIFDPCLALLSARPYTCVSVCAFMSAPMRAWLVLANVLSTRH